MTTRYKKFVFESYNFNESKKQVQLHYSFDDKIKFTETITLEKNTPLNNIDSEDFNRALFALHLVGGISYYKAFLPRQIEIRSGQLTKDQSKFWNKFYTNGLGEFFYNNKIDPRGLINFPCCANEAPLGIEPCHQAPRNALVPFGGGKDSQVTVEILQRHNIDVTLFRMQPHPFITELAKINHLPLITVERQLDPKIYELNKQNALNGHVPITGYVTFLTIILALLGGQDSVFFSNERSSNFGNVNYLSMAVNHQWSKSFEAEQMLSHYISNFVTQKVQYLNILRPLSELGIMKIFCRQPKYFDHITSCNKNWLWNNQGQNRHSGKWCGQCEKCAFVFALFAAFLPLQKATQIFGKNLFDDNELLPFYRELWGAEKFKPFECVGTPQEMQAAMHLATKQNNSEETLVGKDFVKNILPKISNPQQLIDNELSPDFKNISPFVKKIIKQENINEHF